ncbi:MAG: hypothetical protein V3V95_00600 [Thermodesulfobacteriota bacterium]
MVAAGRRSGKTELSKRRLVVALPVKKPWVDYRCFAAAPTKNQAKRIFWNDLKALIPQQWVRRVYETDMCIVTKFSSEIWVLGLDKPQRIEGIPWDGGVLDEYGNMKSGVWTENIRAALSDRLGWCWFVGVPEGFNHYKDLADYAQTAGDPDWGFYSWHSADILPASEVEAAKRVMDSRTFRQEYEASFEGSSGRVYYAYSSVLHQDSSVRIDPALPIIVCCDFNVDPCVWELAQTDSRKVWVFDEVVLKNTSTIQMGKELLKRYGTHEAGFIIYGDAAGSARSTAGSSDYILLMDLGFKNQRIKRSNPQVKDRVNAVNSMLENTRNEAKLFHHPRCGYLRKDFETVEWRGSGADLDKSNHERTHATDALGYFVEYEFALVANRFDPKKRFYK